MYSNVVGDQAPVKGSKALRCGFDELLAIAARARAVISIRTGMLDFIYKTGANMLVLNSDDDRFRSFCRMEQWKDRADAGGVIKSVSDRELASDPDLCILKEFMAASER